MKVLSVVGARPQFVKFAPIHRALTDAGYEHTIIHTGQHYDDAMSDVFFRDLGIPIPNENLAIGSASHARQTALMLDSLEVSILSHAPDFVLVYGDTNSTPAASLASVKIHQKLAHLEAGLRSFNRFMPEAHNRVLTDHTSDLLFVPTKTDYRNLEREGLGERAHIVGDVMTDIFFETLASVRQSPSTMPVGWKQDSKYVVATIHRQENTDDVNRLSEIVDYLAQSEIEIRLLVHPRLRTRANEFGLNLNVDNITPYEALSYPQLLQALLGSVGVVTDSGGLQKEAFLMRRPCITIRTETEWVETVSLGWNVTAPECDQPLHEVLGRNFPEVDEAPFGDGNTAQRVVELLHLHI